MNTLKKLLLLLKLYEFAYYYTDNLSAYATHLPEKKYVVGKWFSQRIERQNLTLRTRLECLTRRTICYSRSEELHDKVIGEFIGDSSDLRMA